MRRIRPSFSRIPSPQSSTPQLLLTVSRSVAPCSMQGLDQGHGDAAEPEPADGERGAVVDVRHGLGGAGNNFVNHR